ncbi:MAG: efflux RND transporter periplasmic adaptor subunit [Pseudomonadota bacterium]|nr:efflux RND transporter periplasmic adaptor subunit [Pseudomonadota bacterium]
MRRIALLSILLLAVFTIAACSKGDAGGPGGGPPGAGGPPQEMKLPVEAVTLTAEDLARGLSTVGTLRADESVVVRPEITGKISRIHFKEGQRVAAGAPLFSLDASVLGADVNEARATLENARRANARVGQLASEQLISRSDADKARADLGVSQARAASAAAQLAKTSIRAPFGGLVGLRDVSVGEVVSPGQALVNLVRLDPMEVDFSVPESDLPRIATGQKVSVSVDAFAGELFDGEVAAIEPVIDANSRSVKLRARINNPGYKLRPGQFARVALGTAQQQGTALLLPEQALMQEGDTRFVYTIVDGKAKRVEIKTGQRVPGKVEVISGLKAGDQVITAGQTKPMMHDGVGVMVLPPPGAPPPATAKPAAENATANAAATQG